MKIMHLSSEYPPTQVFGLGRAVCDLAVAQAALGHEVHVVTNSLGGRDADAMVDGVWVHRIHFPPPPKPPDDTSAVIQFNVLLAQKVVELLGAGLAPEVIHGHDWLTVLGSRAAKHLHPAALLAVTIHDTAHGKYFGQLTPPNQYVSFLERYIGAEAGLVICCSEHVRQELVQQYQVSPEKIAIIPCGVDPQRFAVDVDQESFVCLFAEPGDKLILYVGRLDQEKGIPHLLEALPRVLLVVPEARLLIAGKGVLQQRLLDQARELGVSDRVSFTGYVEGEALAALIQSADVLAVPSLYEPFGIVALEGMICGKPVVAARAGGLKEIVVEGQTGFTVPAGDAAALAAALTKVLTDPELATRLGEAGRQRAERNYTWPQVARQTVLAYAKSRPDGTTAPHRGPAAMSTDLWAAGQDAGPERADIIIPVWNQAEYTRMCLESLIAHTDYPWQIIVVDNGSTDETAALLDEFGQSPIPLTVIRNADNLGFTRAANQGLMASTGRYAVLLNNDTRATPGWLTGLVATAESDDRIGLVGPRTLNPQTDRIHNVGGLVFYRRHTVRPWGQGAGRHDLQFRQVLDVQYVEGSCMLIKRRVIDAIGLLDEVFSPGYYEDSDYCFRAREAGFRVVYSPHSEIYHTATVTATALREAGAPVSEAAQRNEAIFRARWAHRFWSAGVPR